jgi:hypothetical protein
MGRLELLVGSGPVAVAADVGQVEGLADPAAPVAAGG